MAENNKTKAKPRYEQRFEREAKALQKNLIKIPDDLSFEKAAFAEPLANVVHGVERTEIKAGDVVGIVGAGPIGLMFARLAKLKGAKVILAGRNEEKLELAKDFAKVDDVINLKKYTCLPTIPNGECNRIKVYSITRKRIFESLWMNKKLNLQHYQIVWEKYKVLPKLETCIREFRAIFSKKSMPLLYLFIEKYKESTLKEIASFANGLEMDIEAVENAVASDLSNRFVEGINNKIKTIKRTMYGRCKPLLLKAKLMYQIPHQV